MEIILGESVILSIIVFIILISKSRNKWQWKLVLSISLVPFVLLFRYAIHSFIDGFTFIGPSPSSFGLEAVFDTILILYMVCPYIYVPATLFLILSIVQLKKKKTN